MGCLFGFTSSKAVEILFDYDAKLVGLFVKFSIPWDLRAGVIGDVQIFGTTVCLVIAEAWVMSRAAFGVSCCDLAIGLDRAAELEACS